MVNTFGWIGCWSCSANSFLRGGVHGQATLDIFGWDVCLMSLPESDYYNPTEGKASAEPWFSTHFDFEGKRNVMVNLTALVFADVQSSCFLSAATPHLFSRKHPTKIIHLTKSFFRDQHIIYIITPPLTLDPGQHWGWWHKTWRRVHFAWWDWKQLICVGWCLSCSNSLTSYKNYKYDNDNYDNCGEVELIAV